VVAQVVVNIQKKFMDVYVGLLGSADDFFVLKKPRLYERAIHKSFFNMATRSQIGIPPYLLGDKRYPLLLWLMTLHKEDGEVHSILELLYNCKQKKGRSIVENAFDILKQTFI
jgi:hypothetical protein